MLAFLMKKRATTRKQWGERKYRVNLNSRDMMTIAVSSLKGLLEIQPGTNYFYLVNGPR